MRACASIVPGVFFGGQIEGGTFHHFGPLPVAKQPSAPQDTQPRREADAETPREPGTPVMATGAVTPNTQPHPRSPAEVKSA